jgi:beta-glucosidase
LSLGALPHPSIEPDAVSYSEGLLVGYKWFDANSITPRFPFGYGLSYTTFSITNAKVQTGAKVSVSFDLANTGSRAGAEVAQVYVGFPPGSGESPRRLIGWQKVFLPAGAQQHVTIEIDPADTAHPFSVWGANGWTVMSGDYAIFLGTSSREADLVRVGTVRF